MVYLNLEDTQDGPTRRQGSGREETEVGTGVPYTLSHSGSPFMCWIFLS
jgi:hypothetical protein